MNILEVKNLKTCFHTRYGQVTLLDDVNLHIGKKEILGVVGESGCGKSMTSLSIMRLVPSPAGFIAGGEIIFDGQDILKIPEKKMQQIRGNEISMVFQEPMTSLNPYYTCGEQICESLRLHMRMNKKESKKRAVELLRMVNIPYPEQIANEYPHQLSGGMRQRVLIAIAIACNPKLLIADEPTTALDVTIQAQILDLLKKLKNEIGMSVMFITHDLGVISEVAERVAVMYAGKIIEEGTTREILLNPMHPYTKGLIESIPTLYGKKERLHSIEGNVPSPKDYTQSCRFAPRCSMKSEICSGHAPQMREITSGHFAACYNCTGKGKF